MIPVVTNSERPRVTVAFRVASNLGCLELQGLDVRSLLAFRTGGDVEGDALTLLQGLEAARVDCGVVREEILAAVFRCDEAKTFCVVKPFYSSVCHDTSYFRAMMFRRCVYGTGWPVERKH